MERNDIFEKIQHMLATPPMLLVGSGNSAAHDLPNMSMLGNHLVTTLSSKYCGLTYWDTFQSNLYNGSDLESAMSDLNFSSDLLDDIRRETWKLISQKDLELFNKIVFNQESIPLSRLLKYFYQAQPQKLDIITTNYDRVIEYACDMEKLPLNTGFTGYYTKRFEGAFPAKKSINLYKVHGSLDVFRDAHNAVFTLPLREQIPSGLHPEIITPGLSKYEAILKGTHRQLLSEADRAIQEAKGFLCIGYGFNDTQIQENMIQKMRTGTTLVLATMNVLDSTAHLLVNNAKNYITISNGVKPNTTEFCINNEIHTIDGTYWTVDGLMEILC